MNTSSNKVRWGFFLGWALATLVCVVAGFFVFFIAESALGESSASIPKFVAVSLSFLLFTCSFGTVIGVAQWSVLRRYVQGSALWIGATLLGFLISSPVLLIPGGGFGPIITSQASLRTTAALGSALGVVQWLILRNKANRAALWVGISLISWVVAGWIGMALKALSWQMGPILYWLGLFFFGTALSSAGMIWLLKQDSPPADLK